MSVFLNETLASGTITTQNLNPNSGVPTTGGTVQLPTVGHGTATIQVTGVYTGALTPQGTVDGTNWIALATVLNVNTNALTSTVASAATGIFQVDVSGFQLFRISANAAVTGTATVSIRANATASVLTVGSASGSASGSAVTATLTQVASSVTTVVLHAANTARKGFLVFNDSTANLFMAFAATSTTAAYTVKIAAGGFYECIAPIYTGAISGIWDAANGNAVITELT